MLKIRNYKSFDRIFEQCRKLGTWSPLANAFNAKPLHKLNLPLSTTTGLFKLDELKTYDGFFLLKENVLASTEHLVEEACCDKRKRKIVDVFDELSDTLCSVADLAEFVRMAHPEAKFSFAAESTCISLSGLVEKLNTDKKLYSALKHVVGQGDKLPTTPVDDHVAALFLFDFEQCGIHLPEGERRQVVYLNDRILQIGQRFMAGASAPRELDPNLVPSHLRHFFTTDKGKLSVGGLSADADDELAREMGYKAYLSPCPDQEYLLDILLESRYRLAQMCGFPTYAHRALNMSLAENPENVWNFLTALTDALKPLAERDFKEMLAIKQLNSPSATTVAPWDVPYLSSKCRKLKLQAESQAFAEYFSLGTCMDGLNTLFQSLYGITLVNEPVEQGECWSYDVYKLAVQHETEGLLGHIYCDFYERLNKPNQDCHFTIRGGRRLADGTYQNPVVVVMLNVTPPSWNRPSLLTPSVVDNLFHEMGHAMHSMLARTEHQHVTGTRCTMDFAEVPSVLMEYFSSDPRILRTFAKHYSTGQPMPEDMLTRLIASKRVFSASDSQMQVFYSVLDQIYHRTHPLDGTTTDVLAETQNKYYGLRNVPDTAWQHRFSHLVGYGAKYYSYLMSRAVASSIWQSMFVADPLSRSAGERYRRECLAHGGGKPPRALVRDFLQFEPTPDKLAGAFIAELDAEH